MKTDILIRNETKADYRKVEEVTREAFWNHHVPGCSEHYLAHIMREHEDFIPELDYVAEIDGKIVGSIMYTKSKLVDADGNEKEIVSFGPISIHPDYQRRGIGKKLMEHSFAKAVELGFDVVVIFGHPGNYVSAGFKSCKKYNICVGDNYYPTAMLVKELKESALDGRAWNYHESTACEFDEKDADEYDKLFPPKKKEYNVSQEEFYIYCRSSMHD